VYNYRSFQAMLGMEITKDGENGSDAVKAKAEILKYVRDSFALGHKAIAAIRPDTLLSEVKTLPRRVTTRRSHSRRSHAGTPTTITVRWSSTCG